MSCLDPLDYVRDWGQLSLLHKLLRLWQVGVENYASCSCPRQDLYATSVGHWNCHLPACLFLWSLLPPCVWHQFTNQERQKGIPHRCSSLTKGPGMRECMACCAQGAATEVQHRLWGRGQRGLWRQAGLGEPMIWVLARGLYRVGGHGRFFREVTRSHSFFVRVEHSWFVSWRSIKCQVELYRNADIWPFWPTKMIISYDST